VRLEGIRQDKEAVLRQRVCEGGTRCLAKFQARGWSDGSGRECRLDARQLFDSCKHLGARPIAAGRDTTRKGDRNGLIIDITGRSMVRFDAKKGTRKEFVIGGTLDHVCSGSDEL
jgi:hypothetical protein